MSARTAAVIAGAVVPLLLTACGSDGGGRDEIGAKVMCEQFIEDRLRSPGSAEFQSSGEYTVTGSGDRYVVSGYVDAENAFGGSVRADWTCTVENTSGDTWELIELQGIG